MTPVNPFSVAISQYFLLGGLSLLPVLINQFSSLDQARDEIQIGSMDSETPQIFEFIIVGGGTTGSVVANRLSQKYKVLLLEAGGDPFPLMVIPGMASLFPTNPAYDWGYRTVPQTKACLALQNRQSLWLSGKALGGSSVLNFMAYIRGHHLDYDNWARITGDERWSYAQLLKYFKKAENYHVTSQGKVDSTYFGVRGEVHVDSVSFRPLSPYFLAAAHEMGYRVLDDINAPFDEGFGNFSFTAKNGRRWSTNSAFLERIGKNNKLTIYRYSTVSRVLLDESNAAYGVEFERHGGKYTAHATKEIILSAGTVGSPKILMLSGIGPRKHLRSVGIPPKVNLPVGENLQDHIIAFVGPFTIKKNITFVPDRDTEIDNILNFFQNGTGPLSASGIEATGLLLSNISKNRTNQTHMGIWPDVQFILASIPLHREGPKLLSRIFNLREEIAEEYYRPVAGKDSFHIMSVLSRPKSRGNIKLGSKDPKSPPLINPKYLHDPEDAGIILEGVQKILQMVEGTKAFKKIGAKLSPTPFPPCKHLKYRSEGYWKCYLEQYTLSVYHPAGTCAMGPVGNPNSVVDPSLRVIGIKNLRVMDASIMPVVISTNPQSVCIAIGEIGSDFIKGDWKK